MINRIVLASLAAVLLPSAAFAHGGHLGELAGHAHWIGVAALAGAALVAGVVALKDRKKQDVDDAAEADGAEEDNAGEAAQ
ncbi:MAG: hypothetical protein RIE06_05765 [Roseibium album]|uniref:Uncharacterized protein n=1 Tax=Roseibium album TaxID=311410 RepID=A0A0M6ZJ56_9HYPH|nr:MULTISPECIES: DUF6732 family protein [Stappiaceae]MBG6161847.1 hypothetical protein [Labrenzia sp. EL_195]MBG6199669.1 hypothetical protein [Labrenzia sp. EL_13]MCR9060760.1 hypothetical protein [Paracoccaceae bacterium]CTQ62190.1 hypothetical protein LA5094_04975 [Roseibium album]CTQ78661.1 hypothetical protein LA5096_05759 [Roseibium album]